MGGENLAEVRLQEGESVDNALRRFKRKVQQDEIIKEVKRHSYYLKPGEKARLKQALARKRARKDGWRRAVCDYLACMTDRYALLEYQRLQALE